MSAGRQYLTAREWREMFERQGECCALCTNVDGPFEADHSTPNAFSPGKPDQIICVPCHKAKTRRDRKAIAKKNRISGKTRSQWNGTKPKRPWPSRPMSRKTARTREQIMGSTNG